MYLCFILISIKPITDIKNDIVFFYFLLSSVVLMGRYILEKIRISRTMLFHYLSRTVCNATALMTIKICCRWHELTSERYQESPQLI